MRYVVRASSYGEHMARDVAEIACAAANRRVQNGDLTTAERPLDDGGTPDSDHYPPTESDEDYWKRSGFARDKRGTA